MIVLTLEKFEHIKESVNAVLSELLNRRVQQLSIGRESNPLLEALKEVAGYSFAINTWLQDDDVTEMHNNYMSPDHVYSIYGRTLQLRDIK